LFPVFLFKKNDINNNINKEKDKEKDELTEENNLLLNQSIIIKNNDNKDKIKEIMIPARVYLFLRICQGFCRSEGRRRMPLQGAAPVHERKACSLQAAAAY
jgi:hypothetical protein